MESWGERFHRWGPYALLTLGTIISAASATLFMNRTEMYAAGLLTVAAYALQVGWSRRAEARPLPGRAGIAYYFTRLALAFALTWLNPFFAVYAVAGYFDAGRLMPLRLARVGLICTAVTMAGSQSGGLPPSGGLQWLAFGALFALNAVLVSVFTQIEQKEARETATRLATIEELERANARLARALDENARLQRRLVAQARAAGVSDERSRLAAEIHDTIAQSLIGIVTQLQAAGDSTDADRASTHVERAASLARQAIGEARRSVQDLGPQALEHDALPAALDKTVTAWSRSAGIRAELTVTGTVEPLHDEVESTLLRITQEALANVARHAGAGRVGITLSYMEDEMTLDVRDDGVGFDPSAAPSRDTASGGFGIGGMHARAERIAGSVQIETEPGHGTAVSARVPLIRHD